ncbi:MAG: hypothetical protein A2381_09950 [Bdellovibrionales bacterium RIFOXYB1_FULL_37_110]|nr:MAG: hypothetical protein A2181_03030 [Bdellovibrionales bacterium RIFOXYA1_FULL_38_20]OFZ48915.1 MAG: hypothetical protein A2417_08410 [Bdellovibrionales bacterium RIFOXYC1_FULL_37_79]OFZ59592.1 MAG: hypothetical protein A2381_09950 [Bdellovibrionales bacterium RIFOXYB1_FULL_37_110]OFZ62429.1 MAG: hypothetical protein A2577_03305 [Bdellovibrionales bacterium RIFOXYD1_FULL_36_51]
MPKTATFQPTYHKLNNLFMLLKAIRFFFNNQNFLEVMTPPAVTNPGMETHIHPFKLSSVCQPADTNLYLHTSPEFHMKELLSHGFENIFTLVYCFRDEPNTPIHRNQFIMLEWYRKNARYDHIMNDCEELIKYCLDYLQTQSIPVNQKLQQAKFKRMTIQEIFLEYLKLDILHFLDQKDLYEKIKMDYPDVPLPAITSLSWDDCFFLLFLNKIEPHLEKYPYILLYEYPHHLCALSTLKKSDPRVCERFEIYLSGVEVSNCFNELTNLNVQKKRFKIQQQEKQNLYHYTLPEPTILYESLERGLPPSAGIALGIERFLKALTLETNPFWT